MTLLGWQEKHELVYGYAEPYGVLVETGLWNGAGASTALAGRLSCYVIDVDPENTRAAWAAGVVAYTGSSAALLGPLLCAQALNRPVCFWLDAHYVVEGDEFLAEHPCPLLGELAAIRAWPHAAGSTVLIDDVRMLGSPGWPSHSELTDVLVECPWTFEERDDILRLTPRVTP